MDKDRAMAVIKKFAESADVESGVEIYTVCCEHNPLIFSIIVEKGDDGKYSGALMEYDPESKEDRIANIFDYAYTRKRELFVVASREAYHRMENDIPLDPDPGTERTVRSLDAV